MPNKNPKTGLPLGVTSANRLHPEVADQLYMRASAKVYDQARAERYAQLTAELANLLPDVAPCYREEGISELVDLQIDAEAERGDFGIDEPSAEVVYEDITVFYSYLGGAPIVFSCDGPVTYVAAYCSPCVPGAADLNSGPGEIAYDGVPEDWLDKGE